MMVSDPDMTPSVTDNVSVTVESNDVISSISSSAEVVTSEYDELDAVITVATATATATSEDYDEDVVHVAMATAVE